MTNSQERHSDGFRTLFDAEELDEYQVVPTYIEELKLRVSVTKLDGDLYAFADLCTHERCPLSAGRLEDSTIMCQCHGSTFDVRTGQVLRGPATAPLATYPVREKDGNVEVQAG